MQIFLGILLLVMSVFLVIAVLMQNGKSKRLSGSIAGGAETFFGKEKSRTIDAVLSKVTTVVAILFILAVIIVYVAFGSNYQELITPDNSTNIVVPEATETPDEAEGETPAETEGETPAEAEGETPVETEGETPAETEGETPAETEGETPAETEGETPAETETPDEAETPDATTDEE